MRQFVNTMLREEFVNVFLKQRIAIQQTLNSFFDLFFNLFASLESFFSDKFEQKNEFNVDNFVENAF